MASNKNHALLFMSNDILISKGTYKRIYHYWKQDKNKIKFNIITKSIAFVFNTIITMNLDTDMTPIYSLWNGKKCTLAQQHSKLISIFIFMFILLKYSCIIAFKPYDIGFLSWDSHKTCDLLHFRCQINCL